MGVELYGLDNESPLLGELNVTSASYGLKLLLLTLVWVPPASATSVVRFEFDSLCVQSKTIAVVRCLQQEPILEENRGGVYTRTRFEVLHTLKGDPGSEFALTLPGGSTNGQNMYVPGIPQFRPGEQVVIFLSEPDSYGSPWPMGLGQGCYRTRNGEDGTTEVLLEYGSTPLPRDAFYKQSSRRPFGVELERFLTQIRSVVEQPARER